MLPVSSLSVLANRRGSEPYSSVETQPASLSCRGGRSQESPGSRRGWQTHLCQLLAGWLLFPGKRESIKKIPLPPQKQQHQQKQLVLYERDPGTPKDCFVKLCWWVRKWVLLDPLPAALCSFELPADECQETDQPDFPLCPWQVCVLLKVRSEINKGRHKQSFQITSLPIYHSCIIHQLVYYVLRTGMSTEQGQV